MSQPYVSTLTEVSAQRALRNATLSAKRQGNTIVRGSCGTYKDCGTAAPHPDSKKVCAQCAFLRQEGVPFDHVDGTGEAAKILEVPEDWVFSFFQGYDGNPTCDNGYPSAFRAGRKLAAAFGLGDDGTENED